MGKSKPAERVRSVFLFSYGEHEWDDGEADEEEFAQRFLQEAHKQSWTPGKARDPKDLDYYMAPEVTTVEELRAHCEEVLADFEYPEGTLDAPFEKLAAKLKSEGWKFVSGKFQEFEANHIDTTVYVVLEKIAQKPAKKKAAARKPTQKATTKKTPAKKSKTAKKPAAKKKK
jgi:hypothetical protein